MSTPTFSKIKDKFSVATGCPELIVVSWLAYLVALHDIGKCDPDFQMKGGNEIIRPLKESGLRFRTIEPPSFKHQVRSYDFIKKHLLWELGWEILPALTVAYCSLGHHSNFPVEEVQQLENFDDNWEMLRNELATKVKNIFNPAPWSPNDFKDHSSAGILLIGLIVLSDWIASNSDLMSVNHDVISESEYANSSLMQAMNEVDMIGFNDCAKWEPCLSFTDVWKGFVPRPVQAACEKIASSGSLPKLAIIEAPMGDGKTEAAIYLATQYLANLSLNGIYIALPTAATSNQMHGRVAKLLKSHSYEDAVNLVHGMA